MRFLAVLLLLLTHTALADVIWLKNGDRLTGEVHADEKSLTLTFAFGGSVTVPRSEVARWRAQLAPAPTLSKKGVTLASDTAEHGWHLTGSGDLNMKLKQNTSQTNSLGAKGKLGLENPDWRNTLSASYDYDTTNGQTTEHKYHIEPSIDYFLSDRWFWRNRIDYQYDMLALGYLEVDINSGAGYRVWKEKQRQLEFLLLGGARQAYWRPDPRIQMLFGSNQATYPIISAGWDYRQRIMDSRLEIYSEGQYIDYLDQPSPYLVFDKTVDTEVGLRYYLSDHLRLSWSSQLEWDDAYLMWQGQKYPIDSKEWRHTLSLGASF